MKNPLAKRPHLDEDQMMLGKITVSMQREHEQSLAPDEKMPFKVTRTNLPHLIGHYLGQCGDVEAMKMGGRQ